MIVKKSKKIARHARHNRVRAVVEGTSARPRLAVYRSNKHISAQIIDDEKQITLVSASTFENGSKFELNKLVQLLQNVLLKQVLQKLYLTVAVSYSMDV